MSGESPGIFQNVADTSPKPDRTSTEQPANCPALLRRAVFRVLDDEVRRLDGVVVRRMRHLDDYSVTAGCK